MDNYIITNLHDLDLMLHGKGDRIYCLAHFYLQDKNYRQWIHLLKSRGFFITLDNSAAERSLVTEQKLIQIVEQLQPNEVIPPDILFDKQQTLDNFYDFIDKIDNDIGIFACPQGETEQQWIDCYKEMKDNEATTVIGLSKISVPVCFGTCNKDDKDKMIKEGRHKCIDYLVANNLIDKPLHFLGMGDPTEFSYYMTNSNFEHIKHLFRSTDSCYTILAAYNGINFYEYIEYNMGIPRIATCNDFYQQKLTNSQRLVALQNIKFMKGILNG